MIKQYESVKIFAEKSPELYEAFKGYHAKCMVERGCLGFNAPNESKEFMEIAINKAFAETLYQRTGMTPESHFDGSLQRFAKNTMVVEFANAIRDYMIDMILPDTLLNGALAYIADFRFAGLLDSMTFNIKNSSLFTVSKAGYRKRSTNLQKLYNTTVTLVPENHMITTGTDLYEILSGRASIADDTMKAMLSIETQMLFDGYDAFHTAMSALTGNLTVANYSEEALIKACETVTAYNQGRKAVILGTPVALKSVLPSNANYRYLLESEYVKLGHLVQFNNYDVIPLTQVADPYNDTPYSLKLDDSKIYIVSPASDKIVKIGVAGDTMSHTDAIYDNANLLQMNTISKAWVAKVITGSTAICIQALD